MVMYQFNLVKEEFDNTMSYQMLEPVMLMTEENVHCQSSSQAIYQTKSWCCLADVTEWNYNLQL